MQHREKPVPGRPKGTKTFDPLPAFAFGKALKEFRIEMGISQEKLSEIALIERSHVGKIERGEHLPNFALILRLSKALSIRPGLIVDRASELMGLSLK
jgi:transcriptional regulator with XRE-family HTH domain